MPTPSSAALILALDQGGQSTRALVFDSKGRSRASAMVAVRTHRPRAGWVEQDPVEILESVDACLDTIGEALGAATAALSAAGLATQRSSVVCWDRRTGEPLSPVLSWQDRRGAEHIRRLESQAAEVGRITGLVLSPHYGASKIRWCLDHLPEVRAAQRQQTLAVGPLASFLLFHLCRERLFVVDPAIAARTLLWDIAAADWSAALLEAFDIPRSVLPDPVANRFDYGHLEVVGTRVPLRVSTGDQSAVLFANGAPSADTAIVNLGTGAFIQRLAGSTPSPPSGLLCSVVWRQRGQNVLALEGSVNGCGSALEEHGARLGFDTATIESSASEWLARSVSPPLFLNGVSGLGSPYWVADYPTEIVGEGEPWEEMVAVLESIVFLVAVNLAAMASTLGPPARIRVTGGLAALDGLCQRLADLTATAVERSREPEATARGIAVLVQGDLESDSRRTSVDAFPSRENPRLRQRFERWRTALEARLPPIGP